MDHARGVRALAVMAAVAITTTNGSPSAFAQETVLEGISIFGTASGDSAAFDLPAQVSVIEREQIDDFVATRPADIFLGVPGVEFDGGPRRAGQVPTIRGFEGEGIVILFDDARQNFVSGHDGRFFIDTDILVSAEVVKGPTSSIYGSGALGGVIAFRTIRADDLLEPGQTTAIRNKFSFNSVDDDFSYAVTAGQASVDRSVDLVGHFGYRTSGDIDLGSGATLPADDDLKNALIKGRFEFGNGFVSTTSWIYQRLDGRDPENPQENNVAAPDNRLVDRKVENSTLQSKLEFNPADNDWIDGSIVVYRSFNEVREPGVDVARDTVREVETIGFKTSNTSRFDLGPASRFKLTYGTDVYRDEQVGSDTGTGDGTRGGVPNATSDFFGLFAEAEFEFGRPGEALGQLRLIPGVRFDTFQSESDIAEDIDEEAVSPKIAAAYQPLKWLTFFGNYGSAFRAPSYNEAYAIGRHFRIPDQSAPPGPPQFVDNTFVPNPNLRPEEAVGWEIGASVEFSGVLVGGDVLRVKGSYYENDVENLIELDVVIPGACVGRPPFDPCINGGTSTHLNVPNATIDGVEVEALYDSRFFFLRATYEQIDGRNEDTGGFAGNLFPNKFFMDAALKFPDLDTKLGARATFADDFRKNDDVAQFRDNYNLFDVYAVWKPTGGSLKGLRLDLGVDNVTDEDYEIVAAGVSEEGRNYKIGLSYQLNLCGSSVC